jgi:cell division ATPase FtsA
MQLESVALYLEIGSKYFKALMFKTTWRKINKVIYEKKKLSEGISINGIEDYQAFTQCLQKFIYEIEYETSEKIFDIILVYGGLLSNHITNVYKISVKNIVKESDIIRYKTSSLNLSNYEAIHYNYFFIVDHFLYMTNPLGIKCTHLVVKQNYLALYKTIHQNITNFFEENNYHLSHMFFGPYVIAEYIRKYISSFIVIDFGYYNSPVYLVENNIMKEFTILNQGMINLVEKIALKYQYKKEEVENILENVDLLSNDNDISLDVQVFILNFLKKCFNLLTSNIVNSCDLPIFINGFQNFYPIEYFLKIKINRDFYTISSYFQWKKDYEYLYALQSLFSNKK